MNTSLGCLTALFVCIYSGVSAKNATLHRENRSYFILPRGGQFKIVTALAVPVMLGLKQNMAFGLNLQFQYAVGTSISQANEYPPLLSSRSKKIRERSRSDRALTYLGLELIMERYGLNGRSCLLRAICENAMESFHHAANGIYGHLLHIFLTSDYGDKKLDNDIDPIYFEAQQAGRFGADCLTLYPQCPYGHGILDTISFLGV